MKTRPADRTETPSTPAPGRPVTRFVPLVVPLDGKTLLSVGMTITLFDAQDVGTAPA